MTPSGEARTSGGRVVLVTGGSRGIGREIARAFATEGDTVVLGARGREALDAAAAELAATGAKIDTVVFDLADGESVERAAATVLERHGPIGVLINNAAVYGPVGPLHAVELDDWIRAVEINLIGPARMTHAVLPGMLRAGGGSVVNLSGGGATGPKPGYSAYAASKTALVRLTEVLAHELASHGIRVNAIAPGFVATRLHQATLAAGDAAPDRDKVAAQLAEGGQDPRVAAELAVFLASDAAAGVTGRLISAPWDDWRSLAGGETLAGNDLYTLRRIDDMFYRQVPRE